MKTLDPVEVKRTRLKKKQEALLCPHCRDELRYCRCATGPDVGELEPWMFDQDDT